MRFYANSLLIEGRLETIDPKRERIIISHYRQAGPDGALKTPAVVYLPERDMLAWILGSVEIGQDLQVYGALYHDARGLAVIAKNLKRVEPADHCDSYLGALR